MSKNERLIIFIKFQLNFKIFINIWNFAEVKLHQRPEKFNFRFFEARTIQEIRFDIVLVIVFKQDSWQL